MQVKIFGVLNITPDSFSDGSQFLETSNALAHAERLLSEGADTIDIGADSTRPGSICVGAEEEWKRLHIVLPKLSKLGNFSIDTHHSQIAKKAIENGASYINDVFCGADPDMFRLIAEHSVKYVMTYTCCSAPHVFVKTTESDIVSKVKKFFEVKVESALKAGVRPEQIIIDPGMGAFLGDNPEYSWEVLTRFADLDEIGFPIMLGVSRKGFLRSNIEKDPSERDALSALIAAQLFQKSNSRLEYLRVHNVALHRQVLEVGNQLFRK